MTCVHADCQLLLDSATLPYWTVTVLTHAAADAPCWPKAGFSHSLFLTSSLLIATLCREGVGLRARKPQQGLYKHWHSAVYNGEGVSWLQFQGSPPPLDSW